MRRLSHNDNILARYAITADGILPMTVIKPRGDGVVELMPFEHETANTVWANSTVLLLRPEEVTEFLLDDLQMMIDRNAPLTEIFDYLAASNLLTQPGAVTAMIEL